MRTSLLALILASAITPLTAQQVFNNTGADRKASTAFVFDQSFNILAAANVTYGQPMWKDEYTAMLDRLKGRKNRLGKDWWTTLETAGDIEIGGTKIPAGSYMLGLECDKDGNFHLLAMDAKMVTKKKWAPWSGDAWTGEIKCKLKLEKDSLEKKHEKMHIVLTANEGNPKSGSFAIQWGPHQLTANVAYHMDSKNDKAKEAAMDKKVEKKKADAKKKYEKLK